MDGVLRRHLSGPQPPFLSAYLSYIICGIWSADHPTIRSNGTLSSKLINSCETKWDCCGGQVMKYDSSWTRPARCSLSASGLDRVNVNKQPPHANEIAGQARSKLPVHGSDCLEWTDVKSNTKSKANWKCCSYLSHESGSLSE